MVPWWRGGSLVARFPGGEMTGNHTGTGPFYFLRTGDVVKLFSGNKGTPD